MPRTIVVGTRNPHKLREIRQILSGLDVQLRPLDDYGDVEPVPERGETFEANAEAKALGYAAATGEWALADDSGLEVDALDGRPGVHSSRWAGKDGDDRLNNARLMAELAGKPKDEWAARYRCVVALATPDRVLLTASGSCEGRITDKPAGDNGFGYDPYFLVPELGRTMAELPAETKNGLSHRGRALEALRARLEKLL